MKGRGNSIASRGLGFYLLLPFLRFFYWITNQFLEEEDVTDDKEEDRICEGGGGVVSMSFILAEPH